MRHPRRNEVYRDVGIGRSCPRRPGLHRDLHLDFPAPAALLLCSDGLSDLVTSRQILSIVEQARRRPGSGHAALIDAANDAGGKDNVTVVFVEGDRFAARSPPALLCNSQSPDPAGSSLVTTFSTSRWLFLLLGLLGWMRSGRLCVQTLLENHTGRRETRLWPHTRTQELARQHDINAAIHNARSGDTVIVAPGQYHEQIVSERRRFPHQRTAAAGRYPGGRIAVQANDIHRGRFEGFRVTGEEQNNLSVGIQLNDSNVEIV